MKARRIVAAAVTAAAAAATLATPAQAVSFNPVPVATDKELHLPAGYRYQILMEEDDPTSDGQRFGGMADLTVYLPIYGSELGRLWVNHETTPGGGSLLTVARNADGTWTVLHSERVDFSAAGGTWNNCAGNVTPWGTVLIAEEYPPQDVKEIPAGLAANPKLYGWMVEFDPVTRQVRKHFSMGRFSHEGAVVMPDRRTVYMGDDFRGGLIFKFVADREGDLSSGQLYALDARNRRWIEIPRDPAALGDARRYGLEHGATPFNRPEEIEYNPKDGMLYFAETGDNKKQGVEKYGRIWKLNPQTLELTPFVDGGPGTGLFNPDNLAVDGEGNLWIFEDKYEEFMPPAGAQYGNNHVWVADRTRKLKRFATIPLGAEGTGPFFTPDYKTLFFSIQHPDAPWRSSVVAVTGF
ncbi:PhoX family protein [Caldinitratiruptor microaerophilus]|uniref:DUF839 domain-containing protein n=1 Tax=Caldinitratiruptor microaerophilus TaxID=671077 RepID=A0AA35CJY7_9FIRM|nr:PhoX family protein [Caldinitratiruptor microaerophilus]BDG60704.1 hypothetical protein caldi_17940 [Caldinitratiruptor microaerophilus]